MQPQETYLLFAHQRWGTAKYQIFAPPSTDAAAHRTWTRASHTATSAGVQSYDITSAYTPDDAVAPRYAQTILNNHRFLPPQRIIAANVLPITVKAILPRIRKPIT